MLFCFDTQWMFGADGVEVLTYRTADEEPTWRFAARSPITAVALSAGNAIALASDGTVGWFDAATGHLRGSSSAPPSPRDLAADTWGNAAVVYRDSLVLLDANGARPIAAPSGALFTTASFGVQSRIVAVGSESGHVHFFDANSGQHGATVAVFNAAIRSLTAVAADRWLATAGDSVFEVTMAGAARFTGVPGEVLGCVVFDPNTRVFGLQFGDDGAVFLEYQTKNTRLTVTYPERKVRGLGVMGPYGYGVGMDLGDANRFDLQLQTCRTEPHQGRPRNRWVVMVTRPK